MSLAAAGPELDRSVTIVYYALIAGVAMFALLLVMVVAPLPAGNLPLFRPAWLVLAVGSILVVGYVRRRMSANLEPPARVRSAIVIWALAEGPTLFGLVGYMLTGDRVLLIAPLAFFALVMFRYPPRVFLAES